MARGSNIPVVEETPTANGNDQRKAEALVRKIRRQDKWRVQVWAQCEQRIREANAELEAIGFDEFWPETPDWDDEDEVARLATPTQD